MKKNELACPSCDTKIIKSYANEVKMRAKVIRWDRDGMFAVCKSCGTDVPISTDIIKSIESTLIYEINKEG